MASPPVRRGEVVIDRLAADPVVACPAERDGWELAGSDGATDGDLMDSEFRGDLFDVGGAPNVPVREWT